jgi:hypothetical protein
MGSGWWGRFNAKRQFLRRLHKRAGYPWLLTFDDPFVFEMRNQRWQNIDQLEAIVEFYVNFPDPWIANRRPLSPGDPGYTTVSLRPPSGSDAHADGAGNWFKLDDSADLTLVLANPAAANNPLQNGAGGQPAFASNAPVFPPPRRTLHSTIEFALDTARPSRRYRISAVQPNQRRVQLDLDGAPAPLFRDNAASSRWTMHTPPCLVLIDPVGIRQYQGVAQLAGAQAAVAAVGTPDLLNLDGAPDLTRVNRSFDTIYLNSDTNSTRGLPFRAYRIVGLPGDPGVAANQVRVDGNPVLTAGVSPWRIPAGLGADAFEAPVQLTYNLNPPAAPPLRRQLGFDHYDGLMFVVHDGQVVNRFRFSSWTSRQHGAWDGHGHGAFGAAGGWDQALSSIKGNRAYYYESFFSAGSGFRNYCFRVIDPVRGGGGDLVPNTANNDACANAWYFFGTPQANGTLNNVVTQDLLPAAAAGKRLIRVHRGSNGGTGSGSEGCIVSPISANLRAALTARHQQDYTAYHGPGSTDTRIALVCATPQCECATYISSGPCAGNWPGGAQIPDTQWDDKIAGMFWLIRPDEPA